MAFYSPWMKHFWNCITQSVLLLSRNLLSLIKPLKELTRDLFWVFFYSFVLWFYFCSTFKISLSLESALQRLNFRQFWKPMSTTSKHSIELVIVIVKSFFLKFYQRFMNFRFNVSLHFMTIMVCKMDPGFRFQSYFHSHSVQRLRSTFSRIFDKLISLLDYDEVERGKRCGLQHFDVVTSIIDFDSHWVNTKFSFAQNKFIQKVM